MRTKRTKHDKARRPNVPRLEQTAYHEAGHAVIAFMMRRKVVSVTVEPEGEFLGKAIKAKLSDQFRPDISIERSTRAIIEREAMISLAGSAAQSVRVGHNVYGGAEGDFMKSISLISYLCGTPEEASAYTKWLWLRAKNLVSAPLTWTMIARLADELIRRGTMSGREVRELLLRVQRDVIQREIPPIDVRVSPVKKVLVTG